MEYVQKSDRQFTVNIQLNIALTGVDRRIDLGGTGDNRQGIALTGIQPLAFNGDCPFADIQRQQVHVPPEWPVTPGQNTQLSTFQGSVSDQVATNTIKVYRSVTDNLVNVAVNPPERRGGMTEYSTGQNSAGQIQSMAHWEAPSTAALVVTP